jgi:hypothetical protein
MKTLELLNYIRGLSPGTYVGNSFPKTSNFPDDCATVSLTGGFPTDQWTGKKQPTFQVQVRAGANRIGDAEDRAYEIHELLSNQREVTIGTSRVVIIRAMNSTPIYIGTDESNRPIYTMNFECVVRP